MRRIEDCDKLRLKRIECYRKCRNFLRIRKQSVRWGGLFSGEGKEVNEMIGDIYRSTSNLSIFVTNCHSL